MSRIVDAHVLEAAMLQPLMTLTLKVTFEIDSNVFDTVFFKKKVPHGFVNELNLRSLRFRNFDEFFREIEYEPFNNVY